MKFLFSTGLFVLLSYGFSYLNAQAEYPPIVINSLALERKADYLERIGRQGDRITGQDSGSRPNILIILADDLGKNDISVYAAAGVKTPNIERLACEGVVFTDAYATSPVCNPSRAGMVTGRYQQRFGNERQIQSRYARNKLEFFAFKTFVNTHPLQFIEPWYSPAREEMMKQGLPQSEISIFEVLHAAGYRTACIGKWHLGYNRPFLPMDRSIDEFYGFYEAFSLYAPEKTPDIINYRHRIFQNKMIWKQQRQGPSAIVRNGVEIEEGRYLTHRIAEEACQFITNNRDQPFLLYLPFSAPHTPFQAPRSYYDRFSHIEDPNRRVYCAMIAALDDAVGKILDRLEELGLADNTLVFFCSDNGGATYTGATDNGDLKGGKMTYFEGGLNVPFILRWPGKIEAGQRYREPVSLLDVFSTTAASCEIPLPDGIPVDGVDLLPFLTGNPDERPDFPPHDYLFWRTGFNMSVRNGKWKLILDERNGTVMLYDLETDKQEQINLQETYPEVVDQLRDSLSAWESQLMDPLWPSVMEYEEEFDGVKMRFSF
jgi:arylsulfatase A-like enzyme